MTSNQMTLAIPILALIFLPIFAVRLVITEELVGPVAVAWAILVLLRSRKILWRIGSFIPPFGRYLRWAQKPVPGPRP